MPTAPTTVNGSYIPPGEAWTPVPPPPATLPRRRSSTGALVIIVVILVAIFLIIVAMFPSWTEGGGDAVGTLPGDPTFKWSYHGTTYRMDINISKALYQQYHSDSTPRYATDDVEAVQLADQYVTPGEDLIEEIAHRLGDATVGYSDVERANFVLSFVQTIEYVTDEDSVQQVEYWRYPVETLYDHEGDCEDKSFLYASLMEALGYDAVILIFSDHAAAGISINEAKGSYYSLSGTKYYYCETTGTGWEIGDMPDEYDSAHVAPVN
jgi:transglutaminase-like putative cysteine protease